VLLSQVAGKRVTIINFEDLVIYGKITLGIGFIMAWVTFGFILDGLIHNKLTWDVGEKYQNDTMRVICTLLITTITLFIFGTKGYSSKDMMDDIYSYIQDKKQAQKMRETELAYIESKEKHDEKVKLMEEKEDKECSEPV
jgi:hypothetical protein